MTREPFENFGSDVDTAMSPPLASVSTDSISTEVLQSARDAKSPMTSEQSLATPISKGVACPNQLRSPRGFAESA